MRGNVCTTCLAYGTECTHVLAFSQKKRGPPKGTPRGTRTVQSIAKSFLSTSRLYVVPDIPGDTLRILKDLARRVVDLEEQLEAFENREHSRQTFATTTPDSSVTNERSRPLMITHYTPAYTPTYMESENEGQVSGDETSTMNLVKAVVNQLAISTPAPAHLQTSELAQYLKEPDSTSDGDLAPCGNSMGRQGSSVPACPKRKEFWDIHSWQLGTGNQDTSDLTYHGYMFPPSDLLPTLVSLFFTNVHPFFPVLHKHLWLPAFAHIGDCVYAVLNGQRSETQLLQLLYPCRGRLLRAPHLLTQLLAVSSSSSSNSSKPSSLALPVITPGPRLF
ncbi:hypothetical protein PM082_014202 [Marasmius tenuissimus]|nr:hypothetical protein PM082_014202 [Marasmius tenuissimus]